MNFADEFEELLKGTAESLGKSLKGDISELAAYAEERTAHLSTLTTDPDFADAVAAERDAIALKAGLIVTREADLADQRLVGLIQGMIHMAAILTA